MKQSRTVPDPAAVESARHLPLVDLLVDARSELFELGVRSGLKVLETMLEEDRTALCGPRYAHVAERRASRAGTVGSEVVLGGRKVAVRRPRVRAGGHEFRWPTFQAMADEKHALGLWDGATAKRGCVRISLANLQSRGLRTDRSLLVILDGSKALRKAVRATFGEAALVQRCQVPTRNILEYLSERDRS